MKKALSLFTLIGLLGMTLLSACGECGLNEETGEFVACADEEVEATDFLGGIDFNGATSVTSDIAGGTVASDGQGFTGAVFTDGTSVSCGPDGGCIF